MSHGPSDHPGRSPRRWGLKPVPHAAARARQIERRWRWPVLLLLTGTVPAFYAQLLDPGSVPWAEAAYLLAGLGSATALLHAAWRSGQFARHLRANALDLLLAPGLVVAAALPASGQSPAALGLRLALALLILIRMVRGMQHLITRGGLVYLLLSAAAVLGLCGVGFWWIEPNTPTLGAGLWLAFTTAATVGYGDLVPSTAASKIFSVFVVMLGYGVLSLVTAAIATRWVASEERGRELELQRDLHQQLRALRQELAALRERLPPQGRDGAG